MSTTKLSQEELQQLRNFQRSENEIDRVLREAEQVKYKNIWFVSTINQL